MVKHLIYSDLPDEDKLQIDDLYKYKDGKVKERTKIRSYLAILRKMEMECTTEIMNLSQRAIGEKFDLSANSAKPLSKVNRRKLLNKKSIDDIKKPRLKNEKKTCSKNGRKPREHSRGVTQNSLYIC